MFISEAFAQAAPAAAPGGESTLLTMLPLVLMFVVLYFVMIRPQMKRQKEHKQKVAAMKKGDQVVTAGGLVGKVVKVDDVYVELDLGTNVRVKAIKATIGDIIPPGGTPAND